MKTEINMCEKCLPFLLVRCLNSSGTGGFTVSLVGTASFLRLAFIFMPCYAMLVGTDRFRS